MNTLTRSTIAALIDGDAPASTGSALPINTPDMWDDGKAYWFTPDAVVGCEIGMVPHIAAIVDTGSFRARRGVMPEEHGISVVPFNPDHQDVSTRVLGKNGLAYDRWRKAAEAVLAPLDEMAEAIADQRRVQRAKKEN